MSTDAEAAHHSGLARTIRVLQNHIGMEDAISSKDLAERVGTDPSTVRNWISDLRRQGWPIGSKPGMGYFLIRSDGEFRDVMAAMEERRESTAETMAALSSAFYGEGKRLYFGSGGEPRE